MQEIIGGEGSGFQDVSNVWARIDKGVSTGTKGYFTKTGNFKVFYELNGGTNDARNPSEFAKYTTADITIYPPTRDGYKFLGWKGSSATGLSSTTPTTDVKIAKGSGGHRIYTASWGKIYKLSFDLNGGTGTFPDIEEAEGTDISTIVAPLNNGTNIPTKTYYDFAGWGENIPTTMPSGNKKFTAKYTPTVYTITYDLNGGALSGSLNPTSYTYESETFTLNNPNRSGYTFTGWSGTPNTGLTGNDNMTVTIPKGSYGDRKYTANWEKTQEAYVLLSDDGETLTFYYDKNRLTYNPAKTGFVEPGSGSADPQYNGLGRGTVKKVVFDSSFDSYRPTTCSNWFNGYGKLETIDNIKYLHTDKVWSMLSMFQDCSAITSLDLSSFNTSEVTKMENMFLRCQALKTLNVSGWTNDKVTNMKKMFSACTSLANLNLTGFKTPEVTSMDYMFSSCEKIKVLDVSGFNTAKVTSMIQMFYDCQDLETLDISNFDVSSVEDMRVMFNSCYSLTTILVSADWTKPGATSSSNMFKGCYSILGDKGTQYDENYIDKSRAIIDGGTATPGYFTTGKYKIFYNGIDDDDATFDTYPGAITEFRNESITLPEPTKDGYEFVGWTGKTLNGQTVKTVTISATDKGNRIYKANWKAKESYVELSTDGTTLTFYYDTQKSTRKGTKYDFEYKFISGGSGYYAPKWYSTSASTRKKITKVVFDSSFDDYRPERCDRWFYQLPNLTTIEGWQYLHTDNATLMTSMFNGCNSLSAIDLSYFNTAKVTDMGYMFQDCKTITSLTFPNTFTTDKVTDMVYMFSGCEKLGALDLSGFNTAEVTGMSMMFNGCKKLTSLNISSFNTAKVTSMWKMFYDCSIIENITLPTTFTSDALENTAGMFGNCEKLKSIVFPAGFTTENVQYMGGYLTGMFYYCKALTSLDLSKFNTSKVEDMSMMFSGCFALQTLTIDNTKFVTTNVTGFRAMFQNCQKLESIPIVFNANASGTLESMFSSCKEIETLDLSNFDTENVTSMEAMFSNCTKLKSLDLSSFNTSKVTTMEEMFYNDPNLEWLDLRGFDVSQVENVEYMFKDCKRLTTILVGSDWDELPTVTMYGNDKEMFYNCEEIIGDKGTTYNYVAGASYYINKSRARIDQGKGPKAGYLTVGSYKILYDLDGGVNNPANPDHFDLNLSTDITLNEPTNDGYVFVGWTGGPCSGISADVPVKNVTIPAGSRGNREYTAHWTKIYTLKFDTNGGSDVSVPIVEAAGADISAITASIKDGSNSTTKLGYDFTGWDAEVPLVMPDHDMTITALWTPVNYTITIDYADGNMPAGKTNPATYTIETPTFTLQQPVKTGHTFAGWDTGKGVDPDGEIAQGTYGNIAYTATWQINEYTITIDPANGDAPTTIKQEYDTDITATLPTPTREHYVLTGWSGEIPAKMPAYNMTISAQWLGNTHTITFDTDGGSAIDKMTLHYADDITAPANPTKTGYDFKGWDKTIPATMPDEDLAFKAQWEVRKYTITFTDEDGNDLGSVTDEYGKPVPAPADPTREGYDFVSWDVDFPMPMPAEDVTVKAIWKIRTHTITFDTKGGTEIKAITQDYGTAIAAPQNPEKEGHTFTAWDKTIPATMPDEDLTITAQWKVNQYTLTFKDSDGNVIAAITDDFGAPITAPADPVRKGFTFLGWDKAIPATMPADEAELTITAQWRDDRQQIVVEVGSNFNFPNDAARYCDGTETSLAIDYKPVTGTATDYSLTFEGGALPSQSGQLTGGSITVEIPETTERGEFRGSLVFTGDADLTRPSETYIVTIKVDAPRKVAVQLYTDVLIADNHDNLYTAYQWLCDGSELTGETQQYYTSQSLGGTYVVRVTDRNGDTYNSCPLVIGVAQPTVSQSVKIYPNPTKAEERFTVEIDGYDESKSYNLLIYSTNGTLVKQIQGASQQTSLTLPHGNYTGSVISEGQKSGFKLIVK
ncbi:MAG: BspA family leucine-rich repeat surface protein [Bacteroidales bacterium]|nr:BspA family leucine-rich repeat surface protein [Bacteroidales bacterium]